MITIAKFTGSRCFAPHRGGRRAFTLTEMLVVMAIIAILGLLSLSVITSSMRAVRTSACMANLRTLSTAMLLYANEHDTEFPLGLGYDASGDSVTWMSLISGYGVTWSPTLPEPSVWYCPSADPNSSDRVGWGGPSYGANDQLCPVMDAPTSQVTMKRLVQLSHLSSTMMIWDSGAGGNPLSGHWKGVANRWLQDPWPLTSNGDYGEGAPAPRHNGTNIQNSSFVTSFCDGHVEAIAPNNPGIQTTADRAGLTIP